MGWEPSTVCWCGSTEWSRVRRWSRGDRRRTSSVVQKRDQVGSCSQTLGEDMQDSPWRWKLSWAWARTQFTWLPLVLRPPALFISFALIAPLFPSSLESHPSLCHTDSPLFSSSIKEPICKMSPTRPCTPNFFLKLLEVRNQTFKGKIYFLSFFDCSKRGEEDRIFPFPY